MPLSGAFSSDSLESDMSNTNVMGIRFYGTKQVRPTTRSMRRTTPLKKATKKGFLQ